MAWWSRRHALGRLPFWLISRAAGALVVCSAVFIGGGSIVGWTAAYELLIGITSPADVQPPWLAWPLSILGWAVVPAFIGGAAGYVISTQIDRHQSEDFEAVLARLRSLTEPPPDREADGS